MSKPKPKAAMSATSRNSSVAFAAGDSIWAMTYSVIDRVVMNMLLKLCDQTFHSTHSDMEYCAMRMISHISVPRYRYCAAVGSMSVDRNLVTKPNKTTVMSDHSGRSTITSTDRAVI